MGTVEWHGRAHVGEPDRHPPGYPAAEAEPDHSNPLGSYVGLCLQPAPACSEVLDKLVGGHVSKQPGDLGFVVGGAAPPAGEQIDRKTNIPGGSQPAGDIPNVIGEPAVF